MDQFDYLIPWWQLWRKLTIINDGGAAECNCSLQILGAILDFCQIETIPATTSR